MTTFFKIVGLPFRLLIALVVLGLIAFGSLFEPNMWKAELPKIKRFVQGRR